MLLTAGARRRGGGITPPLGEGLPHLTWRSPVPDIALGPSGSWDSTDINNPNVVWDPTESRWVMYYTGYKTGRNGNQDMGVAYADSLDGPWVKDPLNPVYVDLSAGKWSQNGGLEKVGDTWVLAYNALNGSEVWFATSPDLHTWTKLETTFQGGDPFLRINQTTGALECWFTRGNPRSVYRRTSTDVAATWTGQQLILGPAPFPADQVNGGEPSVYVPPGKEGVVMLILVDSYPDGGLENGRGTALAITRDGGATWTWHQEFLRKRGGTGWDAFAAFDTFMAWEGGKFYVYYAGSSTQDTGLLDMGIQIGHATAVWDPAALDA